MPEKAKWMVYSDSLGFNVEVDSGDIKKVTKILFCSECGQGSVKALSTCPHCGKEMENPE